MTRFMTGQTWQCQLGFARLLWPSALRDATGGHLEMTQQVLKNALILIQDKTGRQ